MGFFNNFPYTNFHEMNLDWLIKEMKNLKSYIEQYTAVNKVAYYGIWDITKQYPQWAVVSNGDKTYLSSQAVPVGIDIVNEEFWIELADLDPRYGGLVNAVDVLKKVKLSYVVDIADPGMIEVAAGDYIISAKTNGYHAPAIWFVGDVAANSCSFRIGDFYANYVCPSSGVVSAAALGFTPNVDMDLSATVANIISNYDNIDIAPGLYHCNIRINKPDLSIIGAGYSKTVVEGVGGSPVVTIDCTGGHCKNLILKGFTVKGTRAADGISVVGTQESETCSFSTFENLMITNCNTGIKWGSSGIWNIFKDVRFYGNYGAGLVLETSAGTINHCSFYDCQFSGNKGAIYIAGIPAGYKCNTILFEHCNLELNSSYTTNIWFANGVDFSNCYFENNDGFTIENHDSTINIYSGCSLIPKAAFIKNHGQGVTIVNGLYGYSASSYPLADPASPSESVCLIGSQRVGYTTNASVKTIY